MMHPILKEILDRNPGRTGGMEPNAGEFEAINKAFYELTRQVESLQADKCAEESLLNLNTTLNQTLRMLGEEPQPDAGNTPNLKELTNRASRIQELIEKKSEQEQQLIQETSHLKGLAKIVNAGSWEVDLSRGPFSDNHYWSQELFELLGIEPISTGLSYQAYLDRVHPEDRAMFEREISLALSTKSRYDIEYRIVRPDGTERIVRDICHIHSDPHSGKATKMVGITFDITGTKEAEIALSRVRNEFETLFNTMEEVFWSADILQTKTLQMSPACRKLYGREPEEMIEDPNLWFKVILDEDKHVIEREMPTILAGHTLRNEYRIRHIDGSIRWVEAIMTPTLSIDGKLVRLDGINSDITARKEAEIALRNNELKFRSLIQNSNDTIAICDEQFLFIFASESVTRMLGFSPEEMINTSAMDYIHPEDIPVVERMLPLMANNPDKPLHFEVRYRTKSGGYIWTEGYVSNQLDQEEVRGYVANFRDITERKEYERSLEFSNAELKKTNSELDRFVYSVSHDLRAPLASVLGLLEYTISEVSDEALAADLNLMRESVMKLDIFILDILDYSRNARAEIKKEKINFQELATAVNSSLKFMSSGKSDVEIRWNINEHPNFYSDHRRVAVILNNLISNSVRYHNPKISKPYVEVRTSFDERGVHLTVEDNGIGVDPKHHEKIFDMFFRLSNQSEGSGLGLYLLKETVEKLKGKLEFSSEPGKGTTFNIFLPNLA